MCGAFVFHVLARENKAKDDGGITGDDGDGYRRYRRWRRKRKKKEEDLGLLALFLFI